MVGNVGRLVLEFVFQLAQSGEHRRNRRLDFFIDFGLAPFFFSFVADV